MRHCDITRLRDHKRIFDDESEVRGMGLAATKLMALAPRAATALLTTGAETGFDVTTIMTDSVKTTQSQIFSVLGIVVPAIVAIVAAVVGIKFGISWLKKIKG